MKNNYTVYMHISPSNKRYIGITSQKPKKRWQNGKGYKDNIHFANAINKYGWDNFQHIIIAKGLNKEEARWLEIELIKKWDTTNKNKGYNVSLGGDIVSEETKEKMSKAHKGKHSNELNHMYGKCGKENPFYGKCHSEEAKEKMRVSRPSMKGKNNPSAKSVICVTTNEIFETMKAGAEKYNVQRTSISQCCRGKLKSAGKLNGMKLVWLYYKDYLKMNGEIDNEI